MKRPLLLLAMLIASKFSFAQWSGNNPITTNSDVGIGTSSITAKLTVAGNINAAGQIRTDLNTTGTSLILTGTGSNFQVAHDGTSNTQVFNSSGGAIQFNNYLNSTTLFHIGGNGNIGIGTITPGQKLDVVGRIHSDYLSLSGNLGIGSSNDARIYLQNTTPATGQNWTMISDTNGSFLTGIFGGAPFQTIQSNGNVGIGTTTPDEKLSVNGTIHSKKVRIDLTNLPDYVFKPTYSLRPLSEVKTYIDQNQHLPEVPSATTVEKEGMDVGEMNKILLKKVEELTLYLIDQNKKNETQQQQISDMSKSLISLQKEIEILKTKNK